jgi:hypothetical protein
MSVARLETQQRAQDRRYCLAEPRPTVFPDIDHTARSSFESDETLRREDVLIFTQPGQASVDPHQ